MAAKESCDPRVTREAHNFISDIINSDQMNGIGVYQEPQNHYYSHQPTTAQQAHNHHHQQQAQSESNYREVDADSIGSNGYNGR